jgi:hypothetical protein
VTNTTENVQVLHYPAEWADPGRKEFTLKRWEWAHKKMKNIEVWNQGVPGSPTTDPTDPGMKQLPMPLTGLCVVEVGAGTGTGATGERGVLVIGGGTTQVDENGMFIINSAPVPTNHIHLYHRDGVNNRKWSSTFASELVKGNKVMAKMNIGRMNHACLKIGNKVYVAGGVTKNSFNQARILKQVEVYDYSTNTWRFAADLPNLATGIQLINVHGRPAVVGR